MAFNLLGKILPPFLYANLIGKPGPGRKTKSSQKKLANIKALRKSSLKVPTAVFGFGRLALLIVALLLAAKGQMEWLQQSQPETIRLGWYYFLAAILLFCGTLWPWKREELQRPPLEPLLEKLTLLAVFIVAIFFRTYRLDQMPPGVFFDEGFEGLAALRVLHEGQWLSLFQAEEPLHHQVFSCYPLALWFALFQPSQATLYLYYAFMSLLSFPLIYWFFRELAGPRMALLTLFILAVMRWNVNFSRNAFVSGLVPLFIFGTLAFLQYGLKTRKGWPFAIASLFFGLGIYNYQAHKIFPLLIILWGGYEWFNNREAVRANLKKIVLFVVLTAVIVFPFFQIMLKNHSLGMREADYSIISQVRSAHSLQPLVTMLTKTARMFNREGEFIERHNIPNHRMLDDVTATLFVLGFFYSLLKIYRRKYYLAVLGFLVMSLPCLLSIDPAHSNRMMGATPFLAFLAAAPLAALWGRIRSAWGAKGELIFALVLFETGFLMAQQNYKTYFEEFANGNYLWSMGVWAGYSVPETRIGEMIMKEGEKYDYYLMPRFENFPTIQFFSYFHQDRMKIMEMPADFASFKTDRSRGACFIMLRDHAGVLNLLKNIYPTGQLEEAKDLRGGVMVEFYKVPAEAIQAAKGLTGQLNGAPSHFADFPRDLPPGPYHAVLKGDVFIGSAGSYKISSQAHGVLTLKLGGHRITQKTVLDLARGFYAIEVDLTALSGPPDVRLILSQVVGPTFSLDSSNLTTLPLNHGLKGYWYSNPGEQGVPSLVQWNPVLNFPHGRDFTYVNYSLSIHWEGLLKAPETGEYSFEGHTDEFSKLIIDGKTVYDWGPNRQGSIHLLAGNHKIEVHFRKVLGPLFTFLWKTPHSPVAVEVPMEAFGETH